MEWILQRREMVGLALIAAGEVLLAVDRPAVSDYYFPVVWYGYILTLDGFIGRTRGWSLIATTPWLFLAMVPISAAFWWVFEAFDLAVGSWQYAGATGFSGLTYVAYASICFSTVIPAVWATAMCIYSAINPNLGPAGKASVDGRADARPLHANMLPHVPTMAESAAALPPTSSLQPASAFDFLRTRTWTSHEREYALARGSRHRAVGSGLSPCKSDPGASDANPGTNNDRQRCPKSVALAALCLGVGCVVVPICFPRYAFGLMWVSLFFLLDPINHWLGAPSILDQLLTAVRLAGGRKGQLAGCWYDGGVNGGGLATVIAFALAGPVCGFFWEAWNYWAPVKWVYDIPYVSWGHLFEMPLPGYTGYVPFGLEVYAATMFSFSVLGLARRALLMRPRLASTE